MTQTRYLIAADTGGTFTDLAVHDTQTHVTHFGKTLTSYGRLVDGVISGLGQTPTSICLLRSYNTARNLGH